MTPEDEWDAAMAEQPEHSRIRPRIERGDEERDAVADRMLAREMERRDASARAAPSPREDDAHLCHWGHTTTIDRAVPSQDADEQPEPVTRAEELPTAERVLDLHQQRNFYRDSLRRILGVTRSEGEALIALVEAGWRDLSNLREIADAHGKVTDRAQDLADEYAGSAPTSGPSTNIERIAGELSRMSETAAYIEEHLDIQRTDPDEPLRERLTRVGLVVVEVLDERRRADNRSKRWQARARKAEARVAALTEERDGLTLRLGAKVAKQVRRMPRNAFDAAVNERVCGQAKRKGGRR